MSEQPLTIEKPKHSLKDKAKKAGALAFSTISLAGLSAPVANAESEDFRNPSKEVVEPGLKNVNELSGYKINVGPEMRRRLQASTLEIIKNIRFNETESHWFPSCTGVKVKLPGSSQPYVMTAGHCFSEATGDKYGEFSDPINPDHYAENFIKRANYNIGVADPFVSYNDRLDNPMWVFDGLSINTNYKDLALLRPAPPAQKGGLLPGRSFEQIPAIKLKISEQAPLPGEQVALFGVTSANNFEPVIGTGRYIGRFNQFNIPNNKLYDVVLIDPSTPDADTCNFGASGSMAIRANGSMLGPLSKRVNGGYGPEKEFQNGASYMGETKELFEHMVDMVQRSLQVALPKQKDMTLCFYTVLDKKTIPNLLEGFNNFAPDIKPEEPITTEGSK